MFISVYIRLKQKFIQAEMFVYTCTHIFIIILFLLTLLKIEDKN